MVVALMPLPKIRFGTSLAGGKLYTYEPGTSTPKATYIDSTGTAQNTNPVILDAYGEASVWLSGYYKMILKDANDVQKWSQNNVSAEPAAVAGAQATEWISNTHTFSFVSATQFSVPNDEREIYHVGRRVKAVCSGGTKYGTITTNAFTTITTVTVSLDTGVLDAGLSDVDVSILSAIDNSVPILHTSPPRLTTTQRDAYTAVSGMVIYNTTTARFEVYRAVAWHALVENDSTDTLTNKTLTAPTIVDFTNAQHDHGDADDGAQIGASGLSIMGAYAVGEYILCLAPTNRTTNAVTTLVKIKEMKTTGLSGTLRIKFDLMSTLSGNTGAAQIYRNGVAVGTYRDGVIENVYITYSEDVAGWNNGDLLQIYGVTDGAATCHVKNVGIFCSSPLVGGELSGY